MSNEHDHTTDASELSHRECDFCGYLPRNARGAFRHLLGHVLGTHTTGAEQLAALRGDGGEP